MFTIILPQRFQATTSYICSQSIKKLYLRWKFYFSYLKLLAESFIFFLITIFSSHQLPLDAQPTSKGQCCIKLKNSIRSLCPRSATPSISATSTTNQTSTRVSTKNSIWCNLYFFFSLGNYFPYYTTLAPGKLLGLPCSFQYCNHLCLTLPQ